MPYRVVYFDFNTYYWNNNYLIIYIETSIIHYLLVKPG